MNAMPRLAAVPRCARLFVLIALTSLPGTMQTSGQCVTAPSGLVAWWPAENDAADVQGHYPGGLVNGASYAAGFVGQAFRFDGSNDAVAVAPDPDLRLTGALSVAAWLQADRVTGTPLQALRAVEAAAGSDFGYILAVGGPDGTYRFILDAGAGIVEVVATNADTDWHFVVGTWDGATMKIYVDGALEDSLAFSGPVAYADGTGTGALVIGAERVSAAIIRPYDGLIDELQIFDRALTDAEIVAEFNAGVAGKCALPPPVCGNGVIEFGEDCDDANTIDGDGCSGACVNEVCADPPLDMVSWWQAEGDFLDLQGGNAGTQFGGVSFAPGKVGQAFAFDGVSDRIRIPHNPALQPANLSISVWVQTRDAYNRQQIIRGSDRDDGADFGYVLNVNAGDTPSAPTFSRFTYVFVLDTGPDVEFITAPLIDSGFHHLAATYDGATMRLYVDGVEMASAPFAGPIVYSPGSDTLIGSAFQSSAVVPMSGLIDELQVYDRALTGPEVLALFAAGGAGVCGCETYEADYLAALCAQLDLGSLSRIEDFALAAAAIADTVSPACAGELLTFALALQP